MDPFSIFSIGSSVIGGIFGASEADRQNKAQEKAYREQVKQSKQIARETNKYNRQVFRADKQNYYNQVEYQNQISLQNWERGKEIQDFQYLQSLRQYQKDIGIRDAQLNFNDLAAKQAFANESAALAGIFTQQMFDREDQVMGLQKVLAENLLNRRATDLEMQSIANKGLFGSMSIQGDLRDFTEKANFQKQSALVENLQAQGQNQLRQASTKKGGQATMAEFYRGMSELSSALSGRQRQAALKMAELGVETSILEKKLGIQMEGLDNAAMSAVADAQFNMRVLDADIASAVAQSERNMQQIGLQKYGADLNAAAQVMIKPERLSYDPKPIPPPERIFVKPMKVIPGAVAEPAQQSVFAPLVSGATSALGAAAQGFHNQYMRNKPNTLGDIFKNQSNTSGNIFMNPSFSAGNSFYQGNLLNTQGKLTGGAF